MAFQKREESRTVAQARARLTGMKLIDADKGRVINYGDVDKPLTQEQVEAKLGEYAKLLEEYNQLLSRADRKANEVDQTEREIQAMVGGVLKGAVPKFGADSYEIEQLGGTRVSDRKSPSRKTTEEVKS